MILRSRRTACATEPAVETATPAGAPRWAVPAAAGNAAIGRLLRSATGGAPAPVGFADRLSTVGGREIPAVQRRELETGLGTSLADVRLHTDDVAASAAAEVSAHAFTVGRDIYFARGAYDPTSAAGYRLLAHEATHTLQQDSGPALASALTVSRPHDPAERNAEAVADQLLARRGSDDGDPVPVAGHAHPVIARHSSWEHTLLGDTPPDQLSAAAGPNVTVAARQHLLADLWNRMMFFQKDPTANPTDKFKDVRWIQFRASGLWASNGEVNALADYLPDPSAADSLPREELEPVLQKMRSGIAQKAGSDSTQAPEMHGMATNWLEYIGFDSTNAAGEVSALDNATAELGANRYEGLLSRNACHFAPFSWHRWEQFHNEAVQEAIAHFESRTDSIPLHNVPVETAEHARQAILKNGYGDHFLQDSFAAGHLIDKTLVMQWWLDFLNDMSITIPGTNWEIVRRGQPNPDVLRRMASAAQPGIAARELYQRPPSPDAWTNEHQRMAGSGVTDPQTAQERSTHDDRVSGSGVTGATPAEVEANYQAYLEFLNNAQAQAAAGAVHDHFNKIGLTVTNGRGEQLRVGGDDTLLSKSGPLGADAAAEAAALSRRRVEDHLNTGSCKDITMERIFAYVPAAVVVDPNQPAVPLDQWNGDILRAACQPVFLEYYEGIKSAIIGTLSADMVATGISEDSPKAPRLPMGDFPLPAGDGRAA